MRKRKKNSEEAKRTQIFPVAMVMVITISGFVEIVSTNNDSKNMNVSEDLQNEAVDELRDLLHKYNVTENITINGLEYTMDELIDLYRKYNITENDIKFAMGDLPHCLEGTILDSNIRIIVTETGEPPEGLKEGEDYDMIMSREEIDAISEEATERYIEKYGVDPGNPKIDVINGVPFPVEEVKRLVECGEITGEDLADAEPLTFECEAIALGDGLSCGGPHAIDGKIYVHIFVATDDAHKPTENPKNIMNDTRDALNRFETKFGVDMIDLWYLDQWNASDVVNATNSGEVLGDLAEDTKWAVNENNDIVLGWAHNLDYNGRAYGNGFHAVCADSTTHGWDWPRDSIVQHEISHLFDAPDHGGFAECIMNYLYAYLGTNEWCDNCEELIRDNINGLRILNDNGRARPPGTNITQLKKAIGSGEGVISATIDLSPIRGPGFENVPMQLIFGDNKYGVWAVTTNADYDPGVNKTHDLEVKYTTASGTYTAGCVPPLTVLRRGDVWRDNLVDMGDALYIARYTVGKEGPP